MRRITGLVAALLLTLTLCAALAEGDGFVFQVNGDTVTLTRYEGGDSSVTVPGWYHDRPVTVIGNGAFAGNSAITSVRLPNSISRIGVGAFANCPNLAPSAYSPEKPEGDPHTWDEGVVTIPATCGEPGVMTFTCTGCPDTREEPLPATGEHTWDEGVVTTPPTETEEGVKTFTCTGCGETKTEPIPAEGGSVRVPGDVNDDGVLDSRDVLRLMKYLVGYSVVINESNANVTGDGVIDSRDVLRLMKHMVDPSVQLQ